MQPPRWDDPIGSACREAEATILRGLQVRPTLYGFVDDLPVIRVQPGVVALSGDLDAVMQHLAVVPSVLGLEQALVFSHARLTDPHIGDDDLRDALASYAIDVEVGRREGDEVVTDVHLVERAVEDGEVRWQPPTELETGGWTDLLRYALAPPRAVRDQPRLTAAVLAYGLSRWGTVVEVAPGWRERLGTDRLDRREVRPGDRRRARDLTRRRAATRRTTQEVGT